MRFLTQTLHNVFYVFVGKCYFCSWPSQCSRTVILGGLRWDGSWKRPAGAGATPTAATGAGTTDTPPACKPNPNLKQRPPQALFAWNWIICVVMLATVVATTATLSSNSCKNASFLTHFTSVLRKQFVTNDTFLREANSYNPALALRNSRRLYSLLTSFKSTIFHADEYETWWRTKNYHYEYFLVLFSFVYLAYFPGVYCRLG